MASTFVFSMDFGFLCANMYLCIYMPFCAILWLFLICLFFPLLISFVLPYFILSLFFRFLFVFKERQ